MVEWTVVAGKAGFVADFLEEGARTGHVAEAALLREDGVGGRKRTTGVCLLSALCPLRNEPTERENGNCDREPEAPPAKRMGALEILQIDTPREFFGGAY